MIGTNNAVWTRWSTTSGVSGWTSLGGSCLPGDYSTQEFEVNSAWNFGTECIGATDYYYAKVRNLDGSWTKWEEIVNPIIP